MKKFTLINPTSVEEAASSLEEYAGGAQILAGGTDLLGVMKDKINPVYPEALINIRAIGGLDYITEEAGVLKIGALSLLSDIVDSNIIKNKYSSLAEAARAVGTPQLRNMGTLGGNLCQESRCWFFRAPKNRFFCFRKGGALCFAVAGDNRYNAILGGQVCFAVCPSDTAIALTALGATLITNKRSIPISDFYAVLGNALGADEIITEIQVPEPESGTKQGFFKFRLRKSIDFAIASVSTAITADAGNVTDARIVLGGVAPVPYRATDAENEIKGNAITESSAEAAASAAVKNAMPLSNNKYMVQIAKALVKKAILA